MTAPHRVSNSRVLIVVYLNGWPRACKENDSRAATYHDVRAGFKRDKQTRMSFEARVNGALGRRTKEPGHLQTDSSVRLFPFDMVPAPLTHT